MNSYIPLSECKRGHLYRINSRNLSLGVYDGNWGFIGIRTKFGDRYLFTELHWDTGPPHGTVKPIEELERWQENLNENWDNQKLFKYLEEVEEKSFKK